MQIISVYPGDEGIGEIQNLMTEYLQTEYKEAVKNDPAAIQKFNREISNLPGEYAAPEGLLLLAKECECSTGCVALRKIGETVCEMKRLYVKPEFRGKKIGKRLTQALIEKASKMGYHKMRLDTTPSMKQAIQLYHSLGFKEIQKYREVPTSCSIFMEMKLSLTSLKQQKRKNLPAAETKHT